MKKILLLLLFPVLGFSQVKKDTILVFFLGGQSNMQGYGYNKELPKNLKKFKDVYIFQGNSVEDNKPNGGLGKWELLQEGHGTGFSSNGKTNNHSDRFGLELSFANKIKQQFTKNKVALIKYSRNGSSIDSLAANHFGSWDVDFKSGNGINQYDHFLQTVSNAYSTKDIDKNGIEDVLIPAGILWMQGESDSDKTEAIASNYYENLTRLLILIKAAFRNNDLPIILGKISDSGDDADGKVWDYGNKIHDAQEKFVALNPKATIVKSTSEYKFSDKWHYDSAGYLDLGIEFAKAYFKLEKQNQK